jgi:hypothetical protein
MSMTDMKKMRNPDVTFNKSQSELTMIREVNTTNKDASSNHMTSLNLMQSLETKQDQLVAKAPQMTAVDRFNQDINKLRHSLEPVNRVPNNLAKELVYSMKMNYWLNSHLEDLVITKIRPMYQGDRFKIFKAARRPIMEVWLQSECLPNKDPKHSVNKGFGDKWPILMRVGTGQVYEKNHERSMLQSMNVYMYHLDIGRVYVHPTLVTKEEALQLKLPSENYDSIQVTIQ